MFKSAFTGLLFSLAAFSTASGSEGDPLEVVATLPDYAFLAKTVGGARVSVRHIVQGNQDAHFIRPKPSFATMVAEADVLVETGLDLELWLPTVIDKSGNTRVRSGAPGYVAAAHGMNLLEKPDALSASEGHVHIYGNPHVTTSPILMKTAAANIAEGLSANDTEGRDFYAANLKKFQDEVDRRLFGQKLVELIGGPTLCKLAEKGKLMSFLEKNTYGTPKRPLAGYLGGWMEKMLPLRGKAVATYHKNWVYFFHIFGLADGGTIEPKPGIPPSPRHTADLIESMKRNDVRIILAVNYFNEKHVRDAADSVGGEPVVVPMFVGGEEGVDDYWKLVDCWTDRLVAAAKKTGILKE